MTPQTISHRPACHTTLRLGARASLLSRLQSGLVAQSLEKLHPGLTVRLVPIATTGDQVQDRPLHDIGGKGLFTKQLEQALLNGEIDLAVHSYKDVPVTMPLVDVSRLCIPAVPPREDPRDVLASTHARSIGQLPPNARVGTGSLRRKAQLLALRPDLRVELIRGNIDTRVRKLHSAEFDAVILAFSGLKRAGLFDAYCMTPIETDEMLPAAGQGALALQCSVDRMDVIKLLQPMNHPDTALAIQVEREVVQLLNGDCHSPIGVFATVSPTSIALRAVVACRDGKPPLVRAATEIPRTKASTAAHHLVALLKDKGAAKLLAGTQ